MSTDAIIYKCLYTHTHTHSHGRGHTPNWPETSFRLVSVFINIENPLVCVSVFNGMANILCQIFREQVEKQRQLQIENKQDERNEILYALQVCVCRLH